MNRLQLRGRIHECASLRRGPTGTPSLDLVLWHESQVQEAGGTRQLAFTTQARALGPVADSLIRMFNTQPSAEMLFLGFVAPRRSLTAAPTAQGLRPEPFIFFITHFELES